MAVKEITQVKRFIGLHSDDKPAAMPGSLFYEIGEDEVIREYMTDGTGWYPTEAAAESG